VTTTTSPATESTPSPPWADDHRRLTAILDRAGARLVDEAVVLSVFAERLGIPVPRRLATLAAGGSGWDWLRGRAVPPAGWAEVLAGMPEGIAARPGDRRSADRSLVASRSPGTGEWRTAGRRVFDDASLADALRTGPRATWLVEERLHDHGDLAPIGRPGRLTVLRVATLVGAGGVEVLWAALRRGSPNFLPPDWLRLDADRGVVDRVYGDALSWEGPRPEGHPVPHWGEARAVVVRLADAVLPLRAVTVDVAVTEGGPVLLGAHSAHTPEVADLAEAALPRLRAAVHPAAGAGAGLGSGEDAERRTARLRRRAGEQREVVARIRRGAAVWGVPWHTAYRRALRLRRTRRFRLEEAVGMGLLDPACTWDAQSVAHAEMVRVQGTVNALAAEATDDKVLFTTLAASAGLPVPRRLAVLARAGSGWDWTTGRPAEPGDWASVLAGLPGPLVVKPAQGYGGRSVRVLIPGEDGWRLLGGGRIDAGGLAAEMLADPEFGVWSVEERIGNHGALAALGDPDVLKTVRMVTLVDGDGGVHLLWAAFRLAQDGPVDNARGGSRGTVSAWVDVDSGAVTRALAPRAGNLGPVPVAADPRSGTPLAGFTLPHWGEAREAVLRGARAMLPLRTLGWDVAITGGGPVVVEANAFYDPVPGFPMRTNIERVRAAARPRAHGRPGGGDGPGTHPAEGG
jgi:hypothetical protein